MSVIFQSDFTAPTFAGDGWTVAGPFARLVPRGCNGSWCAACGNNTDAGSVFEKWFGSPGAEIGAAGSVRFFAATPITHPSAIQFLGYIGSYGLFPNTPLNLQPQFQIYVYADGHIGLRAGSGSLQATSAPGVWPVNGTWASMQIAWTFSQIFVVGPGMQNVVNGSLAVNGSVVITMTNMFCTDFDGPEFMPPTWAGFAGYGASTTAFSRGAIDNVQLANNAAIVSYPVCSAVPFLNCSTLHPDVDDITMDCAARRITITGTQFPSTLSVVDVTLDGNPVTPITIISFTATEIVIELPYVSSGLYCVDVNSGGNPFCKQLDCGALASGLTIDCATLLIHITGTSFASNAVVRLWGPPDGDEILPITIVNQSSTEIVVSLPGPFVVGTYCASVENP